jgi:hypothetical protein
VAVDEAAASTFAVRVAVETPAAVADVLATDA